MQQKELMHVFRALFGIFERGKKMPLGLDYCEGEQKFNLGGIKTVKERHIKCKSQN